MTHPSKDLLAQNSIQTVAFYNLENLFDIYDDELINDKDFLPASNKRWTLKRYKNKLRKLGFAISSIGVKETGKHPAIIGLAEVENALVLQDLIASKHLADCNYDYVHYDSPDERGIDVALLFDKTFFKVTHSETYSIKLFDEFGEPDYTRDILVVSGILDDDFIHVIVNHWSSRREGETETEHKRLASSNKVSEIITSLQKQNHDSKIIIIGDFNDDPSSNSIKQLVINHSLFNPMETLRSYNRGTSNHRRQWNLFDQIFLPVIFLNRILTN